MKIFLCIVISLFAGLHTFAVIAQVKKSTNKVNDSLMVLGAVIALISVVFCAMNNTFDWILALIGFGLIVCAAIRNGIQKENFHIKHHIVRIGISVLLILGLFLF